MENNFQIEARGESAISNFKGDVEGGFLLAPVNRKEVQPPKCGGRNDVWISEGSKFTLEQYQGDVASQQGSLRAKPVLYPRAVASTMGHKQADSYLRKVYLVSHEAKHQ